MNPDQIEEIKKSYIFKNATDVKTDMTNCNDITKLSKDNIISQFENFVKQQYPECWQNYQEGKFYSSSNEIVDNILDFISKLIANKYKQIIYNNNDIEKESKQVIVNLIDSQIEAIYKLNKIFNNIKIDITPIAIYLISLLIRRL